MKKSFVMYMAWGPLIKNMKPEDAGLLIQSIYIYQETGQEPDNSSSIYPAFAMIRALMDEDAEKYDKKCKNLKNSRIDTESIPSREKNHRVDTESIPNRDRVDTESMKNNPESAVIMSTPLSLSYTLSDTLSNTDNNNIHSIDIERHFEDEKLNEVFLKYLEARGNTGDAEYTKRKLYDMAKGDVKVMIQILEESLAQGWKGIFPLKDEKARGPTKNKLKNHEEREYDMSELERELVAKSMRKGKDYDE